MNTSIKKEVILIKIGGSSITKKDKFETVNHDAITWLVEAIQRGITEDNEHKKQYIIVHGAGSFGHHTAKEYGLKGIDSFPTKPFDFPGSTPSSVVRDEVLEASHIDDEDNGCRMRALLGLSRTRMSVQKLNQIVVTAFLERNMPAVAVSPCFSIVHEAMSCENDFYSPQKQQEHLRSIIQSTIDAGLIPILHGDAGLFRDNSKHCISPAIISGDTIMQMIGTATFVNHVVFITDVDGVYSSDPKCDPHAKLIPKLHVDTTTSSLLELESDKFAATNSSYRHDVTGGLRVR
jgi:isopentenyl phosphate kinase